MWQVMYYSLNGRQMPDMDNLSDLAMDRYSAPAQGERVVAVARQVGSGNAVQYGYRGGWHDCQPTEWDSLPECRRRFAGRKSKYSDRRRIKS